MPSNSSWPFSMDEASFDGEKGGVVVARRFEDRDTRASVFGPEREGGGEGCAVEICGAVAAAG